MRMTLLFVLFTLLSPFHRVDAAVPTLDAPTYDALVVLEVEGLDDAMLARLSAQVGKQRDQTLEYACTWSGVVVLKMNEINVTDRADVITMARRLLLGAGIEQGVEVLHVHMAPAGTGKC